MSCLCFFVLVFEWRIQRPAVAPASPHTCTSKHATMTSDRVMRRLLCSACERTLCLRKRSRARRICAAVSCSCSGIPRACMLASAGSLSAVPAGGVGELWGLRAAGGDHAWRAKRWDAHWFYVLQHTVFMCAMTSSDLCVFRRGFVAGVGGFEFGLLVGMCFTI